MHNLQQRVFAIALIGIVTGCGGGGGSGSSPIPASPSNSAPVAPAAASLDPFSTAIMADSPLAFYPLDDTNAVAADASGNALNGTVGASVAESVAGLAATGHAMTFPALQTADGVVIVAPATKLQPSHASIEALVRFSATPADYSIIAGYGKSSGSDSYELYFKTGHVVAQFVSTAGVKDLVSPSALAANTTYQIDATFDGATASLYLNGALVSSAPLSGTLTYSSGGGLSIGGSYGLVNPGFSGTIDDVSAYGSALSATRVAAHHAAAFATPAPSPSPTPTPVPLAPKTTPTPTATPTATPSLVATYYGCPVFSAADVYNSPIANASVDPNSAAYINAVYSAGNTAGFYASGGAEKVNLADSSTPLLNVVQKVSYHTFSVPYPWQSSYYIEPLSDSHAMIVQTSSCHLYESYSTTFSNNTLSAYSGANWDLTKPFVPMAAGQPSAMASGLSMFAGAVRWEDYQSGAIRHVINWTAVAHSVAQYKYVAPASDTDQIAFYGGSLPQLPYGARLRLHASFSTAGWGPQATMIAQAMKTYGIILADTGSSGNGLFLTNAADGSNPWNNSDLSALGKIHVTDFDVMTLPPIQTVPGH